MSTKTRPELSKRNRYWIDKHRYYELKHFCLQYPIWKEMLRTLDGYESRSNVIVLGKPRNRSSKTEDDALRRKYYSERIDMLKSAAKDTDPILGFYILRGVLSEMSYDKLTLRQKIPCSRDKYYELYRRFFWLLSKVRK